MASKRVPKFGEAFLQGGYKLAKVTIGLATDNPDVVLPASATAIELFKVARGVIIENLIVNKRTAFGSTGAMTVTIGDTDVDGWLLSTQLVATDAGVKDALAVGGAYKNGKVISSAAGDTLDTDGFMAINATFGTAKPNAGLADIYLLYIDPQSF